MTDEEGKPPEAESRPDRLAADETLLSGQAKTLITAATASLLILFHFYSQESQRPDGPTVPFFSKCILAVAFCSFAFCVVQALFAQGYLTEGKPPRKELSPKTTGAFSRAYVAFSVGIVLATLFFIVSLFFH